MATAACPTESAHAVAGRAQAGARLLSALLFVTILSSPFVFVEPSGYEAAVLILAIASVALRVPIDRRLLPLLLLLLLWALGGAAALVPVMHDSRAVTYFIVSFYLQATTFLFACLVTTDTARRLATLRTAYIVAAFVAAAIGIAGYFKVVPFHELFVENDRARATFKDPNVFGPFLVLPLLFLIQGVLMRGLRMRYVIASGVIVSALFLSFSRGAWAHFAGSAAFMLGLMFVTAPSLRFRARIVSLSLLALLTMAAVIAFLLTLESVESMFDVRASLSQSYDVGHGGRFGKQAIGLGVVLDHPNGLGPEQFGKYYGQAPHNVYLNAFLAYGWLGGFAFVALMLLTLAYGLRAVLLRTPWQSYLMAVYATFVGVLVESAVIDIDHWRHFFLLLGLLWGLIVVAERARGSQPRGSAGLAGAEPTAGAAVDSR